VQYAEGNSYHLIYMKDDSENCYYYEDFNDSPIHKTDETAYSVVGENASPFIITKLSGENKTEAQLYKVEVKNTAPANITLHVVADVCGAETNHWEDGENITLSKVETEPDTDSTFTVSGEGGKTQYVEIETPTVEDLNLVVNSQNNKNSDADVLTDNQANAAQNVKVSIKADVIKVNVDNEGNITPDSSASQEEQKAVTEIEKVRKSFGSNNYQAEFIDLSVTATVTTNPNTTGGETTKPDSTKVAITQTAQPLQITVPLKEDMRSTDAKKFVYNIIRYHDGTTDVLKATPSEDGTSLTFKTDRFSTYAIAYREQADIDKLDFSGTTWEAPETSGVTYTGTEQTFKAELQKLPEGCTAEYKGITATEVGEYKVEVVSITYKGTTYSVSELDLPKAITAGYSWGIMKASNSNDPDNGDDVPKDPDAGNDDKTNDKNNSNDNNNANNTSDSKNTSNTSSTQTVTEDTTSPAASTPTDGTADTGAAKTPKKGDTAKKSGNTYTITSAGKKTVAFTAVKKNAKTVTIPSKVKINGVTYTVTSIAADAFSGNKKLTKVTIPTTVTKIGKNAFNGCTALTSVTIPKYVTTIGAKAFYGCSKLSKVTFKGNKITKIGSKAFSKIAKKTTIKVPEAKKKAYKKLLKESSYTKTVK
jgi:hypothetical protein